MGPPLKVRISDAMERALRKAIAKGRIYRAGGFGIDGDWKLPDFDRSRIIDRCIAAGLMRDAPWYNTYQATPLGVEVLRKRDLHREKYSRRKEHAD